ncbi:MAG: histidinol-phosphatase HisJ family protein [Clostridiales bacterium]|nr:histidinol-phosphatase HisJ family protein [Clostridiales bacterium]
MIYYSDSHIHSQFSSDALKDGTAAIDALCLAAIDAGLDEIAITDHYDTKGIADGIYEDYDAKEAYHAIMEARERYKGRIVLTYGIELSDAAYVPKLARAIIDQYPFDFVLGALHNLNNTPDFYYFNYEKMGDIQIEHLFAHSLREISEMLNFEGICSLAHLTYMHRYVMAAGRNLDINKFTDQIVLIYEKMIHKGIALELNTSPLRSGYPHTMPPLELIKLYRSCGGELVTVGSDAHRADHVGAGIKEGYEMLRAVGFRYITVFRNRKPEQKPI